MIFEEARPQDVKQHFTVDYRTAVRTLHNLADKGWLLPVPTSNQERTARYELKRSVLEYFN